MELQVLVHGVDVVKDVMGDAGDDAHQLGVMELPLGWGGGGGLQHGTKHAHLQ